MARNPTVAGEGLPARYGFSGGKKTPNTRPFPRFAGNASHKMPQDHCTHCIAGAAALLGAPAFLLRQWQPDIRIRRIQFPRADKAA